MTWIIRGGRPLLGDVTVGGAKNTAFKLMIAALLADDVSVLENVPDVGDTRTVAEMIRALGGQVEWATGRSLIIDPGGVRQYVLDREMATRCRASILFAGPLLARLGEAVIPLPGGDRIGRRPVDRHLAGLLALGVETRDEGGLLHLRAPRLRGARYRFPKSTHTGTETLLLAAVCAEGETLLENAACEPEVDDLIAFLRKMGAQVERLTDRTIRILGVAGLHGARHSIMPDRNEAVTYACAALITRGDVTTHQVQPVHLTAFIDVLKAMRAGCQADDNRLRVWYDGPLRPVTITTSPHPGFMTDWHPLVASVLTQAEGVSVVHETVFENRFGYVPYLRQMGARIELFNPEVLNPDAVYNFNPEDDHPDYFHAARIFGPTPLRGACVHATDVRAGAALVLAALAADGETTLTGIEHIERGYERLDLALRSLGADIRQK
ncbi:MAG TPA: UDP-N-acetylglucosamine 1-carboxyvinyltransferase [Blastocatellia bacterium]|nr:UDP-N-acetylglucosamine 1-carboxyvinyltransferase [Blastocatellia bacterium]